MPVTIITKPADNDMCQLQLFNNCCYFPWFDYTPRVLQKQQTLEHLVMQDFYRALVMFVYLRSSWGVNRELLS